MHVAPVFAVGVVVGAAAGGGRGPVERLGRFPPADFREDGLEHLDIIRVVMHGGRGKLVVLAVHIQLQRSGLEHLHLIIAAQKGQRRVMAQAAHVLLRLLADGGLERRGQVVKGAGVEKVLPHQQAQLVADIIKEIVGIISAAPDADGVEMSQLRVLQQTAGALRRDPAEEVVLRDIVAAHGEHLHPVDDMAEFLAPLILLPGDGQSAQADAALPLLGAVGRVHRNAHLIQRLLAVTGGPPQLRVFDHDAAVLVHGAAFALRRGQGGRPAPFRAGLAFHMGRDLQEDLSVPMLLQDQRVLQPDLVHAHQTDRPPDSRVRQTGAPIPAEHAVGLTDMLKAGDRVRAAPAGALFILAERIADGRIEPDLQHVFPGQQQGLHVPLPGDVHVVGVSHRLTVQADMGQRIQPLAAQQHLSALQHGFFRFKYALIHKIVFQQGKGLQLVFPVKGVGKGPVPHQVGIHRAGHRRLTPTFLPCLPHEPLLAVQRVDPHRSAPLHRKKS